VDQAPRWGRQVVGDLPPSRDTWTSENVDAGGSHRYARGMKQAPLTLKRWRRVEYERLVDLGGSRTTRSSSSAAS